MLIDAPAIRQDGGVDTLPQHIHHLTHIFGIHHLRDVRKTGRIGKQHSDQLALVTDRHALAQRGQLLAAQRGQLLAQSGNHRIHHSIAQQRAQRLLGIYCLL